MSDLNKGGGSSGGSFKIKNGLEIPAYVPTGVSVDNASFVFKPIGTSFTESMGITRVPTLTSYSSYAVSLWLDPDTALIFNPASAGTASFSLIKVVFVRDASGFPISEQHTVISASIPHSGTYLSIKGVKALGNNKYIIIGITNGGWNRVDYGSPSIMLVSFDPTTNNLSYGTPLNLNSAWYWHGYDALVLSQTDVVFCIGVPNYDTTFGSGIMQTIFFYLTTSDLVVSRKFQGSQSNAQNATYYGGVALFLLEPGKLLYRWGHTSRIVTYTDSTFTIPRDPAQVDLVSWANPMNRINETLFVSTYSTSIYLHSFNGTMLQSFGSLTPDTSLNFSGSFIDYVNNKAYFYGNYAAPYSSYGILYCLTFDQLINLKLTAGQFIAYSSTQLIRTTQQMKPDASIVSGPLLYYMGLNSSNQALHLILSQLPQIVPTGKALAGVTLKSGSPSSIVPIYIPNLVY